MAERKTKEKRQEELSKKLGDLLISTHHACTEDLVHETKKTDDYIVTLAVDNSNGNYKVESNGDLEWDMPEGYGYQHLAIIVKDRDYKLFIPYLDIKIKIFDKENNLITENDAPYAWHPFAQHYGFDVLLPKDGEYYFEIHIEAPKFNRHHKSHGKRYLQKVIAKLGPLEIMLPGSEEDEFKV